MLNFFAITDFAAVLEKVQRMVLQASGKMLDNKKTNSLTFFDISRGCLQHISYNIFLYFI